MEIPHKREENIELDYDAVVDGTWISLRKTKRRFITTTFFYQKNIRMLRSRQCDVTMSLPIPPLKHTKIRACSLPLLYSLEKYIQNNT